LVVYGNVDEITPPAEVENLLKRTTRQKTINISAAKIMGADHFFTNQQDDLVATVGAYLQREMGQPGR
jgi:alpha/beta superfamily hydrolase